MDANGDGILAKVEFIENSNIEDKKWAKELFLELDPQGRGASTMPEYLNAYGNWARSE